MLRSDLCDYSGAYIVVKGDIALEGDNDAIKEINILHLKICTNDQLHFKN